MLAKVADKLEYHAFSGWGILAFLVWCIAVPKLSVEVANYGISFYTAAILVLTGGSARRDRMAVHAKLDDLECAIDEANSENARLEEKTEDEIKAIRDQASPR